MNKIIFNPSTQTFQFDAPRFVPDLEKFYGVVCKGERGFITRQNYEEGRFKAIVSLDGVTNGNEFTPTLDNPQTSLDGAIKFLIEKDYSVYEFNTARELYAWLAAE